MTQLKIGIPHDIRQQLEDEAKLSGESLGKIIRDRLMDAAVREKMIQTAIRLPISMHERLKASKYGLSEEIRRRVERTFIEDDGRQVVVSDGR